MAELILAKLMKETPNRVTFSMTPKDQTSCDQESHARTTSDECWKNSLFLTQQTVHFSVNVLLSPQKFLQVDLSAIGKLQYICYINSQWVTLHFRFILHHNRITVLYIELNFIYISKVKVNDIFLMNLARMIVSLSVRNSPSSGRQKVSVLVVCCKHPSDWSSHTYITDMKWWSPACGE